MLHRREFLRSSLLGSSGLVIAGALAGCAGTGASQALSVAIQDAQSIAQGLGDAVTQLQALNISGLQGSMPKVTTIVSDIQTVVSSLAKVDSANSAQTLVRQLETDVNTVVGIVASLPLPPQIQLAFQAAAVLLPFIETSVGLVVTQIEQNSQANATSAVAGSAPSTAAGVPLSLHDKAVAILTARHRR